MLVAQVISTNAFYKQVMAERRMDNNNINNQNNSNINEIIMLEKMIKALKQEIDNLKNNTN